LALPRGFLEVRRERLHPLFLRHLPPFLEILCALLLNLRLQDWNRTCSEQDRIDMKCRGKCGLAFLTAVVLLMNPMRLCSGQTEMKSAEHPCCPKSHSPTPGHCAKVTCNCAEEAVTLVAIAQDSDESQAALTQPAAELEIHPPGTFSERISDRQDTRTSSRRFIKLRQILV
jgi:hypothetical protein